MKKANKELLKLFGKKNCHDITGDGGKAKKKKDRAAGIVGWSKVINFGYATRAYDQAVHDHTLLSYV